MSVVSGREELRADKIIEWRRFGCRRFGPVKEEGGGGKLINIPMSEKFRDFFNLSNRKGHTCPKVSDGREV